MTNTQSGLRRLLLPALLLPSLFCTHATGAQQPGAHAGQETKFLDARVHEFEVRNQTLVDALWQLARGPAPFGFGFEHVLKGRLSDPDAAEPRLNIQLKDKSVREILDALCQADSRYTWSTDGPTVDVFPRSIVNDASYLLNRRLPRLELRDATNVQNGLFAIAHQLPPPAEQIAHAQAGGDDPYPPEPWTITFEDLTVRQAVNRIATHGGPCAVWIFGGAKDFRAFGFSNTLLCSIPPPAWFPDRAKSPQEKP